MIISHHFSCIKYRINDNTTKQTREFVQHLKLCEKIFTIVSVMCACIMIPFVVWCSVMNFFMSRLWLVVWRHQVITLSHWGRVTHTCVSKLTNIGLDSGLSPGRRQAIIWNNAGILLIGPLGTNFSEFQSKFIHVHSRKCIWKYRLINGGHFVSASRW